MTAGSAELGARGARAPQGSPAVRAVLAAGLLAGALDITAAITFYWLRDVPPVRILQSVASGLLGSSAFTGGATTALLGLFLHFCIALSAAAVYYAASRRFPALVRRPLAFGALYGVVVYAVMNHVVVPLSALPARPFDPSVAAPMVGIHILCVGLPIAFAIRRFGREGDV